MLITDASGSKVPGTMKRSIREQRSLCGCQFINISMKTIERERRDWMIIPIILVIGFLCVLVAGQWALRFSPRWQLNANMDSNLDPNSDFLTSRPNGFIEPVDPSILTQPAWADFFLTPGASFATKTPFTLTST